MIDFPAPHLPAPHFVLPAIARVGRRFVADFLPATLNTASPSPPIPLREHVARSVRRYLRDLNGHLADDIYQSILREVEIPLFTQVLDHCGGNQSRAAALLGIHRATLRKKLRDYGL